MVLLYIWTRKTVLLAFLSAFGGLLNLTGCSHQGVPAAEYHIGTNTVFVTVSNAQKIVQEGLENNSDRIDLADWYRNVIFNQQIYYDVVLAEYPQSSSDALESLIRKEILTEAYRKGQKVMDELILKQSLPVAGVSVIVFKINTNLVNTQLKAHEFTNQLLALEKKAGSILESLQKSGHQKTTFKKMAEQYSDNQESASNGGALGYITPGIYGAELDEAVFQQAQKGLVNHLIRTWSAGQQDGFLIVMVTEKTKTKNASQIAKMTDRDDWMRIMADVKAAYYDRELTRAVRPLFRVDTNINKLNFGARSVSLRNIKDSEVLFTAFDVPYSWKMCREILEVFVPDFAADLTASRFSREYESLKKFAWLTELAKANGQAMTLEEENKIRLEILQNAASQKFNEQFYREIDAEISGKQEAIRDYYKANLNNFRREGDDGRIVLISFREAVPEIIDILKKPVIDSKYAQWREQMKQKYQVQFYEKGIRELMRLSKAKSI